MSEDVARLIELIVEGIDLKQAPDAIYELLGIASEQALMAQLDAAVKADILVGVEENGKTRFLPPPLWEVPNTL